MSRKSTTDKSSDRSASQAEDSDSPTQPTSRQTQNSIPTVNLGSCFQRVAGTCTEGEGFSKKLSDLSQQLTKYGQAILNSNTIIMVTNTVMDHRVPTFLRLIIGIFLYLLRNVCEQKHVSQQTKNIAKTLEKQPTRISFKSGLWGIILAILKRRLFNCEPALYYFHISSIIVFRQQLISSIFFLIGQQDSLIKIERFLKFYEQVSHVQSLVSALPTYIYYLMGGSHLSISVHTLSEHLRQLTSFLSGYLNSDNIMIQYVRSITHKKNNEKDNEALQKYIFIVSDFRKSSSPACVDALLSKLFPNNQTFIDKSTFLDKISELTCPGGKLESNIFSKLFELIKLEFYLIETDSFKQYASTEMTGKKKEKLAVEDTDKPKGRYYLDTLERLMNKCPFNGDEKCNCKKCQCVRRNRESAKNSQQKKREAVEQIGPLYERVKELETKNNYLEKENLLLKSFIVGMQQNQMLLELMGSSNSNLLEQLGLYKPADVQQILPY